MEEWKEYKLGELCNTISDTYKRGAKEVVLINTSDVLEGKCMNHERVLNEKLKGQFKKTFQYNDILYSEIRPANKRFAFVDFDATDYIASTKLMVLRHNDIIIPQYLFYILKSQNVIDELQMLAESRSGTFPQITFSELSNLSVLLPNKDLQYKIVSILSSLDDKIEVNHRINEQLEELAGALFKSWFADFEPFKDGEFVESELGMIPKGWKVGTLGDVAEVVMGSSPAGSSYNTEGNGSIFYQGRTDFGFRFPCVRMYTTEPKRFAESNSVLLSVRAPVGDVNIAFEKCCIGRGLASIKSNCNADSYTYYLMKSLKPILDNYNNEGTVFGCINKDALNNLSIVVPTIDIIKEFEQIVFSFDVEIRRRSEEIHHLTTLRDTLLPKLMSGEIDVNEVKI